MSSFTNAKTAIRFEAGSYEDNNGNTITFQQLSYKTALVSVGQSKKIIKTEMQGRDGTVKEYIGLDDYAVTVTGIITGENGVSPTQEVIDLKNMLDAPIPIDVVCPYLQNLGIYSLVVESYELPQFEGGVSYQNFTINFSSDIPIALRISENNQAIDYNGTLNLSASV
jgi:hypothetical protein